MEKIVESKAFCRKCKSKDLYLIEVWTSHTIQWEQLDGKFDRNDGYMEMGDPSHVDARCKNCHHAWRVRKALQIDDLIP